MTTIKPPIPIREKLYREVTFLDSIKMIDINKKYTAETESVTIDPKCWNILKVKIFLNENDQKTQIGEYTRNYSSFFNTFVPFIQNGKEYALYSSDYTATRVMRLPECADLCGENPCGTGFCPTDYYVPAVTELEDLGTIADPKGKLGFVAGCHWGDDTSWKIQYLDLSKIEEGILTREDRFGYIELLGTQSLKDAIDMEWWSEENQYITIACMKRFNLTKPITEIW